MKPIATLNIVIDKSCKASLETVSEWNVMSYGHETKAKMRERFGANNDTKALVSVPPSSEMDFQLYFWNKR